MIVVSKLTFSWSRNPFVPLLKTQENVKLTFNMAASYDCYIIFFNIDISTRQPNLHFLGKQIWPAVKCWLMEIIST